MPVFQRFEKIIGQAVDILIGILIIVVLIVMGESIYMMIQHVIPLTEIGEMSYLIEEIATMFILLEIILMLLKYIKDDHHIPIRYLVLISMTAILRELLLEHGGGIDTLYLSLAILVLVVVLICFEKMTSFTSIEDEGDEKII
ncbi:MAG: phosphate-starvation-inducible PsiE family protein [Enterococcus sp.]|nr:phosphate-starvation-inducible PsiE family protein [Enterococcus sp.]